MSILNNLGFEYTVARKSKRKGSKKANPFLLLLMAVVFIALGGCGCYFFLYLPLQKVMQSSSWITTPATVVKSQLATKSSTQRSRIDSRDYSIHIDFQYIYQGKSYIGKRYDFFRSLDKYSNGGEEAMQDAVNRHPIGAEITCLVNPENPSESVISREIYFPMLISGLVPLLFFVVGFIVLIFAIKNIFQAVKGVKKDGN